jgi:hypothetical protein
MFFFFSHHLACSYANAVNKFGAAAVPYYYDRGYDRGGLRGYRPYRNYAGRGRVDYAGRGRAGRKFCADDVEKFPIQSRITH